MSNKRAPSRKRVEKVADAIKFLVPLNGETSGGTLRKDGNSLASWTEKGLRDIKWPRSFGVGERKLIRAIARRALTTGKQ